MLSFGSNLAIYETLQNVAYCHFRLLILTCYQAKTASSFQEQSKQAFLTKFLPHFGILGCFSGKWVPSHFF